MVTIAQVRKLALALPEAEESSHFGQPDFRVRGKIFADVSPDGSYATLKMTPELQAMMLSARPEAFFPAAGYWGRQGWTRYHMSKVQPGELQGLLEEAWLLVAPKRLAASRSAPARTATAKPQPPVEPAANVRAAKRGRPKKRR